MSAKLYKEIMEYLKNQRGVLKSFEHERPEYMNKDVKLLFKTLYENIDLLDDNVNKYVKGEDK